MNYRIRYTGLLLVLVLVMIGCAQVPKEAGFGDVESLVGQRVDYQLRWNQGTEADQEVEKAIEELLEAKLESEGAIVVVK